MIKKVFENIRKIISNKVVKKIIHHTSNIVFILFVCLVAVSIYANIKTKGKEFNVPSVGPYMWMSVLSNSMKPELRVGDLVVDKKIDVKELKVGDVITFRWNTSLSTHRIAEIITDDKNNISFKTKGDNNNAVDQEVVKSNNVIGKYMFRIPFIGFILTKLKGLSGVILIWVTFIIVIDRDGFSAL